jgi:hypothetical protein
MVSSWENSGGGIEKVQRLKGRLAQSSQVFAILTYLAGTMGFTALQTFAKGSKDLK